MKSVLSGQQSIIQSIKQGDLLNIKGLDQDRGEEIRYSKHLDFTDDIAELYTNEDESFGDKVELIRQKQTEFRYKDLFSC